MASAACNRARLAVTASAFALVVAAGPALAQDAAPSQDATSVGDIIVTAQKREQSIQDVPIAVTALSAENLDAMKIEGGSELMRAIPNVSFSKNNFSMYNFSIRGIGTKAISAASDPAVAVSFNNSPLIRNRLFEQEYLDVNRVEVLRGPQGTLYGRNATAGVVNMIPNLPGPIFEAMLKAEAGNYGSARGQMMVNIPLTDTFWVRGAASLTKRDGFDHNTFLNTDINNRDLYSTRLSAAWEPSDRFNANLIWEHFNEDDNRSRTGKQLCTRDPGPSQVGAAPIANIADRGRMSQGCLPVSLYSDSAYGAPNGSGLSQLYILSGVGLGYDSPDLFARNPVYAINAGVDPYEGVTQSRNLREVATSYDPKFRASNDVFQLNLEYNILENVTFHSQTAYAEDSFYSTQDYARYMSNPIFNDSDGRYGVQGQPSDTATAPGGRFIDPQLGASNRMEAADLSLSDNRQWSQEFRVQSHGGGRFNFNLGANYIDFKTEDNYYVFNNTFNYLAKYFYDATTDLFSPIRYNECVDGSEGECIYVDHTPISNLAGDGHNYFRSKNVVSTRSLAVFGEGYFDINSDFRLTAGLRYTDDTKKTIPYPSQLLLGSWDALGFGPTSGGSVVRGYVPMEEVKQNWSAVTGRLVLDWKPSDDILVYGSYSRGYKGGGTNPPRADINPAVVQYQALSSTFEPEYVNAFEIGIKSDLDEGRLRLNASAFYYDYKDYQVSQIVDRISLNENFDATSMGLELEAIWRPTPDFRIDANLGFLKTRIADGEGSIDVMNRTQGNKEWMTIRPWVQVPSNCIAPTDLVEQVMSHPLGKMLSGPALAVFCGGSQRLGSYDPNFQSLYPFWAIFGFNYNPLTDAPNGGRGFDADLGGNELPNAPRVTANIGAQYTWHLANWGVTLRGDYYRQSSSYFRIFNTDYDLLKGWDNANITFTMENSEDNIIVQAYVKNAFDKSPIVDAFTNSDDSMLTTNVFTLDPRVFGFSVAKRF